MNTPPWTINNESLRGSVTSERVVLKRAETHDCDQVEEIEVREPGDDLEERERVV